VVVPAAIMVLVIVNVVIGRVYWLGQGCTVQVFTDGWRIVGTILLKIGFALGLASWFLLANIERTMKYARPGIAFSVVFAATGVILCLIGCLR
jgi:hypothetical protein